MSTYHPIERALRIALLLALAPSSVWGWGTKEHMQLTRIAAERLVADPATPSEMRDWIKRSGTRLMSDAEEEDDFLNRHVGVFPRGANGIEFWSVMPDLWSLSDTPDRIIEPFGVHARLLHFIDLEYFVADESKRTYAHDLSHCPKLEDLPDNMADWRYQRGGMLPFAVRDAYERMVKDIRTGRLLDEPGRYPREEHAVKWAGILAHYLEDNTQPQHATADYRAVSYFADKRLAPNVHPEVEYRMCDDDHEDFADLRREYLPLFRKALEDGKDPEVKDEDPWKSTIQVSIASYGALPLIGEAAMAATAQAGTPQKPVGPAQRFDTSVFFHFKGHYLGQEMTVMQMKARQSAWAVHRVERLWLAAWREASEAGAKSPR